MKRHRHEFPSAPSCHSRSSGDTDRHAVAPVSLLLLFVALGTACESNVAPSPPASTLANRVVPGENARPIGQADYLLEIKTGPMPNPALRDRDAQLHIRRHFPLCGGDACPIRRRAVILVHGASISGVAAFDLDYEDYSLMAPLASHGFDVFAISGIGWGKSSHFSLDNPCNASPAEQAAFLVAPRRPLAAVCAGDDPFIFTNTDELVHELNEVVEHVRQLDDNPEIHLLGWSAGAPIVGVYALRYPDKVTSTAFLSGVYGLPSNPPASFAGVPLAVRDAVPVLYNCAGGACCPDQRDPAIIANVWSTLRGQDATGASWGIADPVSGGVLRFPTVTRWGWNATTAATLAHPTMVIGAELDQVVPIAVAERLYQEVSSAVAAPPPKVLLKIACASHATLWERAPHVIVRDALIEWFAKQKYQSRRSGVFRAVDGEIVHVATQ